ncbi:MAG: hypothetical protein J6Q13_02025 [Clostridia bacterium]|nr:hypothetical protein [Clostridia bacterium]
MSNADKIEILKENIIIFIKTKETLDENAIFNFAKQQAKEMKIEITMGEIKSIIYDLINEIKTDLNNNFSKDLNGFNFNQDTSEKLIETSELIAFEQPIDI